MKRIYLALTMTLCLLNTYAQVNLQTGAAEQHIPLINYSDARAGLSLNVGLMYSSGNGLLVSDVASDIGTGWSLLAGGMITRIQRGEPDDQQEYNDPGGSTKLENYPNGYLYNPNYSKGCSVGASMFPIFNAENVVYKNRNLYTADTEQDKFFFSFNGRSGVFIIDHNWNVRTLGDSKLKFSISTADMKGYPNYTRTSIKKFVITTEEGIEYHFDERGVARLSRYKLTSTYFSPGYADDYYKIKNGQPSNGAMDVNYYYGYAIPTAENPYIVNKWYLTKIYNPNTKHEIVFNYESLSETNQIGSRSISHAFSVEASATLFTSMMSYSTYNYLESNPTVTDNIVNSGCLYSGSACTMPNSNSYLSPKALNVTYIVNRGIDKQLTSISLPFNQSIVFGYDYHERPDAQGRKPLNVISYNYNGLLLKKYRLKQAYFYKNSIVPVGQEHWIYDKFYRLCLLGIEKVATPSSFYDYEPPYEFSYYTGSTASEDDIVPPCSSLAQDFYGYYNGSNSNLPVNSHEYLTKWELVNALNPTKRYLKPLYARNGLLKTVKYPTGGILQYEYSQAKSHWFDNTVNPSYLPDFLVCGVTVSATTLSTGDVSKDIKKTYDFVDANGKSSRWGDESPSYYNLQQNVYDLSKSDRSEWRYAGIEYPEMATTSVAASNNFVGALLLNSAISIGANLLLHYLLPTIAGPVGWIMAAFSLIQFLVSLFSSPPAIYNNSLVITNSNNKLRNSLGVHYSRVEIKDYGPAGYLGKTVMAFTDFSDHGILVTKNQYPYPPLERLINWKSGLPKETVVYDKNGNIVSRTLDRYSFNGENKIADAANQSCFCFSLMKEAAPWPVLQWTNTDYEKFTFNPITYGKVKMNPQPIFQYTGRVKASDHLEAQFKNGNLVSSVLSLMSDDPITLQPKLKITQLNNIEFYYDVSYYAASFNSSGIFQKMTAANMEGVPIGTERYKLKSFFNGTYWDKKYLLIASTMTEFEEADIPANGTIAAHKEIRPKKVWELSVKEPPVFNSLPATNNLNSLLRNTAWYKEAKEFIYDTETGRLRTTVEDEYVQSMIYDYDEQYVTANVLNAAYNEISFSSFEGNAKGGWDYAAGFIKADAGSITGAKAFKLGYDATQGVTSTIMRTGLNASKKYRITYWAKGTVNVNGNAGELLLTSEFDSNWKLYSAEVTGVTGVTLTGDAIIDELRLYPDGALMSTASYLPGAGKTDETDANNRTIYYEYDGLSRLRVVRDQNRNIIKTYDYNYKK